MALTGERTYVGFGLGAIQAGLFLHEACASGGFRRLVVAEVVPAVIDAVRRAGGLIAVNVARADCVEAVEVGPVEVLDPAVPGGRQALVAAIAEAAELGTAVPSVDFYAADSPGSIHRVLAEGLRRKATAGGPRAVVYAAENHNDAAGILAGHVGDALGAERPAALSRVRFLDTVIGKMSGVVTDATEIAALGLRPVTPGEGRAFLVEAFNRILVSRVAFDEPFERGLSVFEEKDDLVPFEEAKLYGHNAAHALAAYVGAARGVERIAGLREVPGAMAFLRAALIEESGAALVERRFGIDPLFTWNGFRRYADDLIARMMNPFLRDTVERVGRDPARKLGWDDRLVGAMRLALGRRVRPRRYALGAAAALGLLRPALSGGPPAVAAVGAALGSLWQRSSAASGEQTAIVELVVDGLRRLRRWRAQGFGDLELLFHRDDF